MLENISTDLPAIARICSLLPEEELMLYYCQKFIDGTDRIMQVRNIICIKPLTLYILYTILYKISYNLLTMIEKLYKRKLVDSILKYLDSKAAIVIYGARQVGKTSVLKYLMHHHLKQNVFYLDLELKELLDLCNKSAEEVYRYLLQKGADKKKRIYLIIDEIQYLDNPASFIKIFHDHYPSVKLLVSGSSTFELKKKFRQSLAGRTVNFELHSLSFEEYLLFKNKSYNLSSQNTKAVNDELVLLAADYIRFGGYPQIVMEESEEKKKTYLSQIINTYIRKDIRDIGNIRDISSFNKLLELLASQSGNLINALEISGTLGINRDTLLNYLDLLENTFIIKLVRPYHKNIRSELTKQRKIYFLDTGLLHLLWLKEFPKIIHGNVFETFVFLTLLSSGKEIYFWRTVNKQEVDFIVSGKKLYAIEAKLNFSNADDKNLRMFSEKYKCTSAIVSLFGERKGKYIWELAKEI